MGCNALGNGVQSAMTNVANLVQTLPASNVHRHIVVVTFVLRRHQTNVHIEIQALEGGVRATGLLCLLGITVGLGSVFIYRLYTKLFSAADDKHRRRVSDLCSSVRSTTGIGNLPSTLDTPDSGVVVDSAAKPQHDDNDDVETPVAHRSPSHMPRSFSAVAGLHRRNSYAGSLEDVVSAMPSDCPQYQRLRRTLAVADWLAQVHADDDDSSSVVEDDSLCDVALKVDTTADDTTADDTCVSRWSSADHGFMSGLMTDSAELDASRMALTTATNRTSSIFPASSGIAGDDDDDACLQHPLNLSTEPLHLLDEFQVVSGPYVRRRRMSIAGSMVDEARRWRSQRRYSLSVANSAVSSEYDYRESLVSKGFSVDLGEDLDGIMTPLSTKRGAGMTVTGMESLHQALKQIQRDVDEMNRKFDGLRSSAAVATEHSPTWSPADKSPTEAAMQFACGEPSEQEADEDLGSERQQTDYIWDYRSDLVPEGAGDQFVALRPIVPSSCGNFVLHQGNLPRDYSDLCTEASTGCETDDGMLDLYIDDDFDGTDNAVGERVPEKYETESQLSSDVLRKYKLEASPSQGTIPMNCHSTPVCSCISDVSCCNCCRHPVSCSHSDSCCITARRHCSSHCGDVSPLQTRRFSMPDHPHCQYHPHHDPHTRPSSCRHRDNHGHHCNFSSAWLRHSHIDEYDCCNNIPPECYTARSSTPADETSPLDHCNNFHNHSNTSSVVRRSVVERRPVGEKQDIRTVIDKTFTGCTALQQSCMEVLRMWGTSCIREMGCDSGCVIRAVLYAAMLDDHPILQTCGNLNDCCQKLETYIEVRHRYLQSWAFHEMSTPSIGSTLEKLVDCLRTLYEQMEISGRLSNRRQRDQYLSALLNGSPVIDQQLTEAVKVVVMLAAINAHETYISGVDVSSPVIVWQTFGRMSSLSAEMFFHQHINRVCDGVILGEDKLDLSFLAYALGLRVQVFHPSHAGQSDSLRHYPDEGADHLPLVRLMRTGEPAHYFVTVV